MSNYRRWLPIVALLGTAIASIALPSGVSATTAGAKGSQPSSIGPCPVFPADNAWNTDISNYPLDPNSQNYINTINASRQFLHPDFGSDPTYGIPYVVVSGNPPFYQINFTESPDESDPGPYPVPLNAPIESGSDAHVLVVDTDNCTLYEMYHAQQVGSGWNAGSGAVFNLQSDALRPDSWTSADAAGLPIFAGLVRFDEVQSGVINHALRFTVSTTQAGFIHPATHLTGSDTNPNLPPMGLRLRLKASFNTSSYHGAALVILTALKKYGMIVADNGSAWYISGQTNVNGGAPWDDNDLDQLKQVPGSAFEVVKTGPILRGPGTPTPIYSPTPTSTPTPSPTITPLVTVPPPSKPDTFGVYRTGLFLLRNTNTTGYADVAATFNYGSKPYPVIGDWNNSGADAIGLYDQSNGQYFLRNSATSGSADEQFVLGNPGDEPIAGTWTGVIDQDGVGVFRPSNGLLLFRNALSTGYADYVMVLGIPGDQGLAGDWNGGGVDGPGVYRPSIQAFLLSNTICNCSVYAYYALQLGNPGDSPVTGDWTAQGHSGAGVFRPSNGLILLKNQLQTGYADIAIIYGIPNDVPVAGHWVGSSLSIPIRGIVQPPVTSLPPSAVPNPPNTGLSG